MMSLPETRHSLLVRLRDTSDQAAWQQFAELYEPALLRLALRLLRGNGIVRGRHRKPAARATCCGAARRPRQNKAGIHTGNGLFGPTGAMVIRSAAGGGGTVREGIQVCAC